MPDSEETYISWYPECLKGFEIGTAPPSHWDALCRGETDAQQQAEILNSTLTAFDKLVPGMAKAKLVKLQTGLIVASGATDITDPGSRLHKRNNIGIEEHDGYFSMNTGKLTSAPMLAHQLVDRIV